MDEDTATRSRPALYVVSESGEKPPTRAPATRAREAEDSEVDSEVSEPDSEVDSEAASEVPDQVEPDHRVSLSKDTRNHAPRSRRDWKGMLSAIPMPDPRRSPLPSYPQLARHAETSEHLPDDWVRKSFAGWVAGPGRLFYLLGFGVIWTGIHPARAIGVCVGIALIVGALVVVV
jgi:hypothetical protein